MSFELIDDAAGVVRIRLIGIITRLDADHVQSVLADAIRGHGKIKVLAVLEDFGGWQSGVDWSDLSFAEAHDAQITRIAVVGEEEWKDDILAFLIAPLRSAAVEFFTRAHIDAANRWLAA